MQGSSCVDIFTRKAAIVDAQNTPTERKDRAALALTKNHGVKLLYLGIFAVSKTSTYHVFLLPVRRLPFWPKNAFSVDCEAQNVSGPFFPVWVMSPDGS